MLKKTFSPVNPKLHFERNKHAIQTANQTDKVSGIYFFNQACRFN